MRAAAIAALLALAGCSGGDAPDVRPTSAPDLETAAIAAGVIPDLRGGDISGLYARESDRLCIVPTRLDFHIGARVDYGDGQYCSGTGRVTRAGETLHLVFDAAQGCAFDARFEGDRIVFPGQLPGACSRLCVGRATLAGMRVDRLSATITEATALRDRRGRALCPAN